MPVASWFTEHKRAVASAGVVTIFSGALVGLALWYDGEATAEVELDDSGIWVTRTGHNELGRFNVEAGALDGVMLANSSSFDVWQDGGRVLLDDGANREASPVDPAHLQFAGDLAVPTGAQVATGGAAAAVYDGESGRLWVLPFDGAAAFDEEELRPTAQIGRDGTLAIGVDGTVYVATAGDDGALTVVPTSENGSPGTVDTERLSAPAGADLQVSAVGRQPVVLNRTDEALMIGDERIQLDGLADAMLQMPSAEADTVAVAMTDKLVNQPLSGGDALTQPGTGTPAAPAQVGGCTYGAWSGTGVVVRDCAGTDSDDRQELEGLSPNAVLQYRVNRGRIILNDVIGGNLWLPTENFTLIDDWDLTRPHDDKGEETESEETVYEQVDQVVADRDKPNNPPEPKDDDLGLRAGRTTVLDVLRNDVDPDGDVMTVSVKSPPGEAAGITVDRVLDGAALQADVPEDATGTVTFEYEVDDGRDGGTASAQVTLKVRPDGENEPPELATPDAEPVLKVAQAGTAEIQVLPYFKDPDGDDLFLSRATTQDPADEVRSRPDGTVEFLDGGGSSGRKIVDVIVSDGQGAVAEGRVLVDVVTDDLPPIPVQDHVTTLVGEPVTVRPLENDTDPNGDTIQLAGVGGAEPAEITPNHTAGTFRLRSEEPGSYDIPYEVTDGPNPAVTGLVRVDVTEPPSDVGTPVVVSDRVLLPKGGEGLVDVLANDRDPGGGVLVVQEVDVPDDSGLTVAVLDHHVLKITENQRLESTVTIGYTASNGEATASGQVHVVPIPASDRLRPPEAGSDEADVHVGDTVTIPVLENDSHPDGLPVELSGELVEQPEEGTGEAFVSEDAVRFRAGDEAGVAHAVYEVTDPNGQRDSAQITINIRDDADNTTPQLPDVDARVLSGGTVRIEVPLHGVDPDGDHVMLSDIQGAPALGRARIAEGFIDFEASPDSVGTDTFTYTATDSRGAVGVGTVRVGIAPPPATNQKPVAQDDETLVRPGRAVAIDALANDTDPDGDQIGLVESLFGSTGELDPRAVEGKVVVTAPDVAGQHPFYYGVQDTYKARAQGTITVDVADDAPLLRPVANDDVLSVPDVAGKDAVTIDVLANDVDPDGVATDLEVDLAGSAAGATLTEDGGVRVPVTSDLQVVTYTVTDMDGLESSAFVRVPGDSMTPHLTPGLEPLEVFSGEPFEIDLNEYVVVADGLEPRITSESTVSAVEGVVEVTGPAGLTYTSEEDYHGPASVSFEVTDGDGPEDPEGRTATLTLPLEVRPTDNQPPEIKGSPVLEVPAGEEGVVDLAAYATDPEGDSLTFEVEDTPEGMNASAQGSTVTARAEPSIAKGTSRTVPFTVSDGRADPVPGELQVLVVASTRPLAATGEDRVEAHEGVAETVDVLANDTNPFPETPLELVGTAVVETGSGEAGYEGDRVVVTPAEGFHGTMRVKYTVQDATGDEDRHVDGVVNLTVLGKPDAPRAPRVEEVRSGTVVLTWDEPNNNGAPVTGYVVADSRGGEHACASTTCTVKGLTNDVTYTFTVRAENEVGEGEPSQPSQEARPDEKPEQPAPPELTFGDGELEVAWTNRNYTDRSPIDCVNLQISPAPPNGATQKSCVTGSGTTWDGLENGTAYRVSVQAKNQAPDPSEWSEPSAPEVPAGPPAAPGTPTATRANTALGGEINVSWTAPADNGDAIKRYHVDVFEGGSKLRTQTVTGTSQKFGSLSTKESYTFRVVAENKAGRSDPGPQSDPVQPYGTPDRPGTPSARLGGTTSGQAVVSWNAIGDFRGSGGRYEVLSSPGTGGARSAGTATSYTHGGLQNGTTYTFQVRACNSHGACSAWSASSNGATPYGPPPKPSITASSGLMNVTFTWDGRGTNGRPTTVRVEGDNPTPTVGGDTWTSTARNGSRSLDTERSETLSACITVTDDKGQSAKTCASGTSKAPTPTATVVRGSSVQDPQCTDPSCSYYKVNYENISGSHSVECWSGSNPDTSGWHNIVGPGVAYTKSFSGTGSFQLRCFYGYPGTQVAVVIDGKRYGASTW